MPCGRLAHVRAGRHENAASGLRGTPRITGPHRHQSPAWVRAGHESGIIFHAGCGAVAGSPLLFDDKCGSLHGRYDGNARHVLRGGPAGRRCACLHAPVAPLGMRHAPVARPAVLRHGLFLRRPFLPCLNWAVRRLALPVRQQARRWYSSAGLASLYAVPPPARGGLHRPANGGAIFRAIGHQPCITATGGPGTPCAGWGARTARIGPVKLRRPVPIPPERPWPGLVCGIRGAALPHHGTYGPRRRAGRPPRPSNSSSQNWWKTVHPFLHAASFMPPMSRSGTPWAARNASSAIPSPS